MTTIGQNYGPQLLRANAYDYTYMINAAKSSIETNHNECRPLRQQLSDDFSTLNVVSPCNFRLSPILLHTFDAIMSRDSFEKSNSTSYFTKSDSLWKSLFLNLAHYTLLLKTKTD